MYGPTAAAGIPGAHLALGGGGPARWLVRLVIWHELWRLTRVIWRIPTFGPVIVVLVVLALISLAVLARRGVRWPRHSRGGSAGHGTGTGPRDW